MWQTIFLDIGMVPNWGDGVRPEVRVARIVQAIGETRLGRLSCPNVAEVLGMNERHFQRFQDRYPAERAEGRSTTAVIGGGGSDRVADGAVPHGL